VRALRVLALLAAVAAVSAAVPRHASGEPEPSAEAARAQAEEGQRLFQTRDFEGAERHFEQSLALDGSSTMTRFWLARTLDARFRETQDPKERAALGERALAEYERVVAAEPSNAEAFAALLGVAGDADDRTAGPTLERLGGDERLPTARRTDALVVLARRGRVCAEQRLAAIVEQPVLSGSNADARDCATRGLSAVDKALALEPERESAWRERALLYGCLAQVAAVDGRGDEQSDYEKRSGQARRKAEQIRASRAKTKAPRSY
jgi:tetratricopeptide (TPR) repeat protein